MDKYEKYQAVEAHVERAERAILDALTNTEYLDWLRNKDADRFESRIARDIEATLRTAHEERIRVARNALARLTSAMDMTAWQEVVRGDA
jgi:hypothetical protein